MGKEKIGGITLPEPSFGVHDKASGRNDTASPIFYDVLPLPRQYIDESVERFINPVDPRYEDPEEIRGSLDDAFHFKGRFVRATTTILDNPDTLDQEPFIALASDFQTIPQGAQLIGSEKFPEWTFKVLSGIAIAGRAKQRLAFERGGISPEASEYIGVIERGVDDYVRAFENSSPQQIADLLKQLDLITRYRDKKYGLQLTIPASPYFEPPVADEPLIESSMRERLAEVRRLEGKINDVMMRKMPNQIKTLSWGQLRDVIHVMPDLKQPDIRNAALTGIWKQSADVSANEQDDPSPLSDTDLAHLLKSEGEIRDTLNRTGNGTSSKDPELQHIPNIGLTEQYAPSLTLSVLDVAHGKLTPTAFSKTIASLHERVKDDPTCAAEWLMALVILRGNYEDVPLSLIADITGISQSVQDVLGFSKEGKVWLTPAGKIVATDIGTSLPRSYLLIETPKTIRAYLAEEHKKTQAQTTTTPKEPEQIFPSTPDAELPILGGVTPITGSVAADRIRENLGRKNVTINEDALLSRIEDLQSTPVETSELPSQITYISALNPQDKPMAHMGLEAIQVQQPTSERDLGAPVSFVFAKRAEEEYPRVLYGSIDSSGWVEIPEIEQMDPVQLALNAIALGVVTDHARRQVSLSESERATSLEIIKEWNRAGRGKLPRIELDQSEGTIPVGITDKNNKTIAWARTA